MDAERLLQYMQLNDYELIEEERVKNADVIIFVSCAFNKEFDEISKEKIIKLLKMKDSQAIFILTGCLPEIDPPFLEKNKIKNYFGPRNLERIDEILENKTSLNNIPEMNISIFDNRDYPIPNEEYRSIFLKEYVQAKNFFKIRVCWGCASNCSYCVIKKATKDIKSKSLIEIKKEIQTGIKLGHKKFFFTGGDFGAYGIDIGKSVVELLENITFFEGISIYIQEFNIQWLIKYLDDIYSVFQKNIKNYNKLFINLPIQSGSNNTLKKMRRPYKREQIIEAIEKLRFKNDKIVLGSHFMVGFPGETKQDFFLTYNLIDFLNLDFLMVFFYSEHPNSASSRLKDKIDENTISARKNLILELQKQKDLERNRYDNVHAINFEKIHVFGEKIEGWLTKREGELLYSLAKNRNKGNIVEIGSWKGKSTFYIAKGLMGGLDGTVYAIDHHEGSSEHKLKNSDTLSEFLNNLKMNKISQKVKPIINDSKIAASEINDDISFIFLDGSHEYEDVKSDFNVWWPKLKFGGTIAFHDSLSKSGVSRFLDEIISSKNVSNLNIIDEILYFKKLRDNSSIFNSINKRDFIKLKKIKADIINKLRTI